MKEDLAVAETKLASIDTVLAEAYEEVSRAAVVATTSKR